MKKSSFIIVLCVPLFLACHSPKATRDPDSISDVIPVKVLTLTKSLGGEAIAVSGQFTTDNETMLSFKTSGIISNLTVKEGDAVKRGQVLATLNPTEINAQLQQAQLNSEKALRDYQRTANLYKDSVATLEQLQNSKTNLQLAKQQLNMVSFNRQYSQIRAEQDGYVLKKLANAGQQISAGTAVLQINGTQKGQWLLRVGLSDQEWAAIQKGYRATIETSAMPGQMLAGMVTRKSEGVDPVSGTFSADIALSGKLPRSIASGMFGKANIQAPAKAAAQQSWQVPYEAVLDGDSNTGYVFVTNDNKTAHKVKVTIGGIQKNVVTITSGLEQSTAIIISGSAYLTDNSAITIQHPLKASK